MYDIKHWIGTVEEIDDPHKCGRVQVRVVGAFDIYSNKNTVMEDKENGRGLPTKDLPWALCSYPITFGGTSNSTLPAPGVQIGAWVHGISFDGDLYNNLVVLGILPTFYSVDMLSRNDSCGNTTQEEGEPGEEKPESKGKGTLTFAQLLDGIHCAESNRGASITNSGGRLGGFQIHPTLAAIYIQNGAALDFSDLGIPAGTGDIKWPTVSNVITSLYGWRTINGKSDFHGGIDIRGSRGTPVYAAADGEVKVSQDSWGMVTIEHKQFEVTTRYLHCHTRNVYPGQVVKAGDVIATVGGKNKYGNETYTPHLHFDVIPFGATKEKDRLNPEVWFLQKGGIKAEKKEGLTGRVDPALSDAALYYQSTSGNSAPGSNYTTAKDALASAGIEVTAEFSSMIEELIKNDDWGESPYAEGTYQDEYAKFVKALNENASFNRLFGMLWLQDCCTKANNDPLLAAFYYSNGQGPAAEVAVNTALGGNSVPEGKTYTEACGNLSSASTSGEDFNTYAQAVFKDHGGFENLEEGTDGPEKPYGRIIIRG